MGGRNTMGENTSVLEPYIVFKKLIKYLAVNGYTFEQLLNMNDMQIKCLYERVVKSIEEEPNYNFKLGMKL